MTDTNNVEKYAEDQTVWDFTPTPNPSTNIAGDTIDSPEKWGALQEIRRVGQTEANKHLREAAKYQYAIHLIDVIQSWYRLASMYRVKSTRLPNGSGQSSGISSSTSP